MASKKELAKAMLIAMVAFMEAIAGKGSDDDDDEEEPKGKKGKSKSIDEDDVKEAFVEFVGENGKPAARKLLKKFGVEKLSELEEDDYAKFMKAAKTDSDDDDVSTDDDDDEKPKGKKGKGGKKGLFDDDD